MTQSSITGCKRALLSVALLSTASALATKPAHAQANEAGADEDRSQSSEIVVTGSRIRGVAPVGSNLISVGQEEVQKSGTTSTSDLLKQVPQLNALSYNAEGASGQNANANITRSTVPALRGLGPTATLVLIDGKRVPPGGTLGQFVDPSMLPPILLERVEVIADGASAIYGSDAVAGVVNLVTRSNLEGIGFSARAGFADGYRDFQVSAVVGHRWGTGYALIAVDRTINEALLGTERQFVSADRRAGGGRDNRVIACSPATITTGGGTYATTPSAARINFSTLTRGTANRCETDRYSFLIPEAERTSVFASASQEIGDNLTVFARGLYSRRMFSGPGGGQPVVNNLTLPRTSPFYPTNAPATPILISTSFIDDVGPRLTRGFGKTWQIVAGAEQKLGGWRIQATGSYGEGSEGEERGLGIDNAAVTAALGQTDPTKALNPFAGPGGNDPALIRSLYRTLFTVSGTTKLTTAALEANGPLIELPGGTARAAVGIEYREESLAGQFLSGTISAPITARNGNARKVKAAFAELYVPIIGASASIPAIQSLDLLAAVRVEDYSDFGHTTNPKVGLTWKVVPGISLRGSFGTSFRAPGLSEMDANSNGAGIYLTNFQFPGQTLPTQVASLVSGNRGLTPETAKTWSAGVDFTPELVSGLRVSATWFKIDYEKQVFNPFGALAQVLSSPADFPTLVYRNDGSARYQEGVALIQSSPYFIPGSVDFGTAGAVVDARMQNLANSNVSGFDLQLDYSFDLGRSRFSLSANGTIYTTYRFGTGATAASSRLNTLGFPQKFRGRAALSWSLGGLSTQAALTYVGKYRNATSTLVPNVPDFATVDLDIGYTLGESAGPFARDLRFAVNVRNLFDRNPNFVDFGLGYDPSVASALGRIISVSVSKSL